ncbi:hypothetical protein MRB53_039953 [Persea americana]|nr:hypothetical protein MRB53_039953 [Persea americana]
MADIRAEAVKALIEIAHHSPEAVRNQAIQHSCRAADVPGEDSSYGTALEAFAQLSGDFQIFDTVVLRLKNKLHAAQHQRASLEYQRALLLALLYAFTFGTPVVSEEGGRPRETYYADFAEPPDCSDPRDSSLGARRQHRGYRRSPHQRHPTLAVFPLPKTPHMSLCGSGFFHNPMTRLNMLASALLPLSRSTFTPRSARTWQSQSTPSVCSARSRASCACTRA